MRLFDDDEVQVEARPFNPKDGMRGARQLEGLREEVVEAIVADVTPAQVRAFVGCLSATPRHAEEVRRDLAWQPWFPTASKRDTQLRFMRTLRDAAIVAGFPVCSTNTGYVLGDRTMVLEAAERSEALARGASARARALRRLAERIML